MFAGGLFLSNSDIFEKQKIFLVGYCDNNGKVLQTSNENKLTKYATTEQLNISDLINSDKNVSVGEIHAFNNGLINMNISINTGHSGSPILDE